MGLLKKNGIAFLLIITLSFFQGAAIARNDCFAPVWAHEKSDLAPDPTVVFGRLENGFRYVLKKNTEPRGRVAMFLDVQAGSLYENDEEQGYAHFLEHMLFNGSTHFPPGKLVEYFQSIGMSYGGDTNAHTGYDETVYDVILPDNTRKNMKKGLQVLADYARGAWLLEREIQRELGVILAEKRSRDSAEYRTHVEELKFSMQGTLIPERMPIGLLETLNKADHTSMKGFYDAWYRPANMILVIVGDFDPESVRPLVEKQFKGQKGQGAVRSCPDLGSVTEEGTQFFYHHESDMGNSEVGIETLWNEKPENDSAQLQKELLVQYVATTILQYRLDELSQKAETPFTSAKTYSGVFLDRIGYGEISAKCDPERWQESLTLIEKSLRQVLQFGFQEGELQRAKKELMQRLESDVLTEQTRNSKELAAEFIRSINSNRVIRSPEQEKELLTPMLAGMKVADVEKAFHRIWDHPARYVKVSGNAAIAGEEPLKIVEGVYRDALRQNLNAYRSTAVQKFPYLEMGKKEGRAEQQIVFNTVDSQRLVFANKVVVNLKKTPYQANAVQVSADFGLGQSSEPVPGLARLAGNVMNRSGTEHLSRGELDRILTGSSVELAFFVKPAAFSWEGKALNTDLELLFQVIQSLLADPRVDPDGFQVSMDFFSQQYNALSTDVQGAMTLHGDSFLADGNRGFGLPSWSDFAGLRIEQLEQWILPACANGPLEISLVGDFDEKEVTALAEKYFSTLPLRKDTLASVETVGFPKGKTLALSVPSSIDKAMLVLAWKSADFWNIRQNRGLHLLAEIFSDKLRRVIRERLGATYSPQVFNIPSRIYPGYGVMQARLIVDPEQIEMLQQEVLQIADELYQENISLEELERAKAPLLTALKDMIRTNDYWLHSVLSLSSRYPQQLEWPATILESFAAFTVEDMQKLSRKFLNPEQAATVEVIPQ